MKLTTETQLRKPKYLIVAKHAPHFVNLLKIQLKKYDINVFVSPELPPDISGYESVFFVHEPHMLLNELVNQTDKKYIFIFFNQDKLAHTYTDFAKEYKAFHIKVINLETTPNFYADDIDTILWFTFSRSEEIFLHIYHPKLVQHTPSKIKKVNKPLLTVDWGAWKKPKRLILIGVFIILLTHLLFIPPLLVATYYHAQAGRALLQKDQVLLQKNMATAKTAFEISKSFYSFARPTLLLFSLAFYPDDIFQLNESTQTIIASSQELEIKGQKFLTGLMIKDKSPEEVTMLMEEKQVLIDEFNTIHNNISLLAQKMPTWNEELREMKQELETTSATMDSVDKFIPHLDSMFALGTTKKYLLLFANNMELRPGGGFIGSFGVLTMRDYTLDSIQVYDVYDADGQLTAHVEPPKAITEHLNQPHWFLRDSAFSPDFHDNYEQAKFFLDKELQMTGFNGGILLTTTSIQNLLEAMGSLYVPDYRETVTKDNFYIKAQLYAEKDFFPGSIQKKRFLGSVMNQMLLEMGNSSYPKLLQMFKKSLDEKQVVIYMDDTALQTTLDDYYWSGRAITPQCANQQPNCVVDYLFPYDANLGVNKANFFINRPLSLEINIDAAGRVHNKLQMRYKNSSFPNVFPGGTYKNYLQIILPVDSNVKQITTNGVAVEKYDENNGVYKTIGFLMEVAPQKDSVVEVTYDLPQEIQKGNGIYQLILQKQIGAQGSDLQLKVNFPENISVVNTNFSPLVKDKQILYNTTITSDKIFIIEFYKE